jgi:hypothetical protein
MQKRYLVLLDFAFKNQVGQCHGKETKPTAACDEHLHVWQA